MPDDFNIMPGSSDSVLPPEPDAPVFKPAEKKKEPATLRKFGDFAATRKAIYDNVFKAASTLEPVTNAKHTLHLKDVQWVDPDTFSKKDRKNAILNNETLGRRLKGTWELQDNATGETLDKRTMTIAKVPHLTEGGTFVDNGSEYALKSQQRLLSGVFTRTKTNGEVESHLNILANGPSHRYQLDPDKGTFSMKIHQANIPLLPLLHVMGASEKEIREAWGDKLYTANAARDNGQAIVKLKDKILHNKHEGSVTDALKSAFERMTLDPEVTQHTLDHPHARLDKDAMLSITRKLLAVSRGEAEPDDRDHLAYQKFMGPEDLFRERLEKDRAGVRRQLLYKMGFKGDLSSMPPRALQQQIRSALTESGVAQHLEESNPSEILDKNTQVTRMGEGGISDSSTVPEDSRMVQPSQFGYVDPLRTPESSRAGVDTYLAGNSRKGSDGKLYSKFTDLAGKEVWKTPQDLAKVTVAFPGAMEMPGKRVPAMKAGRLTWAHKRDVSLILPEFEESFSPLNHLVPLKSMLKGQRASMASRMSTQALSLVNGEAPLVQNGIPGTNGEQSYEQRYGEHMGAMYADKGGQVVGMDSEGLHVKYDDGAKATLELHNNLAYNRKSGITQTPTLKAGDRFKPGQLVASSNFTDKTGTTALGMNARVAYAPFHGRNHEDAIVISESMAKRLSSNHTYQHHLELNDRTKIGKKGYIGLFPGKYDKATLANFDNHGVIKPGTKVKYGDPLILAAEQQEHAANKIHKQRQAAFKDISQTWDHHDDGEVTDVVKGKTGPMVVVKSVHPTQLGDKLSGRYGDKGTVSEIVPDDQMLHDQKGQPYEVLLNPLGLISRSNPAQWAEAKLGAIAAKTGKPIKVEDWDPKITDRIAWAEDLMRQHGLPDTEDIIDPTTGHKIPDVYTGNRFIMKLGHNAEDKGQGRGGGSYTSDEQPAKGGSSGSKRLSMLDLNALLSHGATHVIRDSHLVRGQKNEDYWLQFMQGFTPRQPKVPLVYHKFINELKASGINVVRDGSQLHMLAMTDKDVNKLAEGREIKNSNTVRFDKDLKPIAGGLFDESLTGGHHGKLWSSISLTEPLPSPVMEEPIKRILGITGKQMEDVIAGKHELHGKTGPKAIAEALEKIDVDKEIAKARHEMSAGSQTARDQAVRRLGYLKSAKKMGLHPKDWVLSHVPVLPPQFRPISMLGGSSKVPLVSDPNYLYRELLESDKNLGDMKKHLGEEGVGAERLATYHALKAVTGLGEPITQQSRDKEVKGIIRAVLGSSPKFNRVQRQLLGVTTDNVGRSVTIPDPDLDMDSVGLPEEKAFDVYSRFIVRRLRRQGMPIVQALQEVKDRSPLAKSMMQEEMEHRPVIVNRAPVLHRFGILAMRPRLVKGSAMKMPPLVFKGLNLDSDGDMMQWHVPVSDDARKEALERMLPSQSLISPANLKTPMHMPAQELLAGLYRSTSPDFKSSRPARTFRNKVDVLKAWMHKEIGINDLVNVLER